MAPCSASWSSSLRQQSRQTWISSHSRQLLQLDSLLLPAAVDHYHQQQQHQQMLTASLLLCTSA